MSDFKPVNQTITPISADPGEEFPFLHTITVVDRVVSVDKPELVQNNIKTETVTLNLDSEWDGLSCIINIGNGDTPTSLIWSGQPVTIPAELMTDIGTLNVSVVGYRDDGALRAVTKKADAMFTVVASGYVEGDEPVPDPTTILGQLTEAADRANQAADRFNQASEDIGDISDAVIEVKGYADAAKDSETTAASSAATAYRSETNAASSVSAAKVSEANAAASATAARNAVDGFGLDVGTTTTGEPGTDAAVEIQKNGTKYTANFTIPRGDVGPAGVNENVPLGTASGLVAQATDAYPALPRKVQVHGATSGVHIAEPTKLVAAGKNLASVITNSGNPNLLISDVLPPGDYVFSAVGDVLKKGHTLKANSLSGPDIAPASTSQTTKFSLKQYTSVFLNVYNYGSVENIQIEKGASATQFEQPFRSETNLPSDISLADGDTLTIDRDGTTRILHTDGEPTVLENVTLPKLPAPTFNVYTVGGYVPPTVDVDYEQNVNLVLQALEAKIASLEVNQTIMQGA